MSVAELRESGLDSQSAQAQIAEDALIGSVIVDPSILDRLDEISGAMFVMPELGSLFNLLGNLRRAGKPIGDTACLLAELRAAKMLDEIGGAGQLARWANGAIAHNAEYYAEQIRRLFAVRSLRTKLQRAIQDLAGFDPDPSRITEKLEAALPALTSGKLEDCFSFDQLAKSALDDCLSSNVGKSTIPFGLQRLDAITGGLFPSEITIWRRGRRSEKPLLVSASH